MSSAVSKVAQIAVGAVIGFAQGGPWGAVAGAALAFYVSSQQDQLDTSSLRSSEPSSQTLRSSKASARFVLGRVSTGGVLAWGQEQAGSQTDGEWLHMVYVLSEGAIDGLEDIYLGEEVVQAYGEYASYELVVDPAQVNAFLKANCPDWRDTQIGRGLSYVRLSFKYSAEKYPSGIPDVRFVIRGRRDIYDPRTGMTGYSANTALHILWFLRNRCGVPDDEIVFSSFANSASVCDESVANPDGTTSPRYHSGCVIGADESRTQVMQKLQAACGGKLIRVGGRWMLQVGAYYGPYDFEITEDMVTGTVTGNTEPSNDSAINTVRGTFIDPSQAWAETDYPEVSVAEWVVADGGEAAETLAFSYVSDPYQAQRLANIELRRRRAGGTLSIPMNFVGYNCRPGRSVKVNLPSLNIVGEFIVTDWSMAADTGCSVSVSQNEPAIFDDAVGQPYNPIGFISLPAGGLGSPTNLTWSTDDAAEVVQGVLSWTPPAGTVTGYAVTVRQGTTAVQAQQVPATAVQLPLSGLPSGSYTMSVAALGPLTRSGEASITVSIDGPPIPESCVVQATIDTITLIPGNALHGLNGGTYEYFFSTNPQATEGEYVGQGLSLTHTGLAFATNYAYFVRSKNAYGVSAFLKVVASTSTDVENMLEALKDKINSGQLAPVLREDIALITAPPTVPGSVNQRVEGVRADLGEQITEVSNHVNDVQNELQRQIDEVADLADSMPYDPAKSYTAGQGVLGADGKLYQAKGAVPAGNAPPNATYWTDIGQAVQTANGLAARMTTVETKVTEQDGKLTAQSTRIDGVQSSLTTTNQNVTAAQQAADAANTLAGGKGKVIIQAAAPATADRLAQNLWIDTTGNANTPKRWSGSAWVAVTDKAATDAAAAAASALTLAQTKADANVVDSISSKVTQQGDAINSQGQAITGLQGNLTTTNQNVTAAQQAAQAASDAAGAKGKVLYQSTAPAVADRLVQNLWIDTTSNANTPKRWNGTAWVAVTDKVATDAAAAAASALTQVATKADASTVQSLSNTVDQQGAAITANGQAITNVNASLKQVGGENLLYNPSFDVPSTTGSNAGNIADGWGWRKTTPVVVTPTLRDSDLGAEGKCQRLDLSGLSVGTGTDYIDFVPTSTNPDNRPAIYEGVVGTASVHVRGNTGLLCQIYLQYKDAAGVTLATHGPGNFNLTPVYQRAVFTGTAAPAGSVRVDVLFRLRSSVGAAGIAAGFVDLDQAQFEHSSVVTGWRDNGKANAAAAAANASATTALTGRVALTEQGLTSASNQLTQLDNSIGDVGGENLFYNPTFNKAGTGTDIADGWATEGPATSVESLVTSWLNAGEKAVRVEVSAVGTGTPYKSIRPTGGTKDRRPMVAEGQTIATSIYLRGTAGLGFRFFIQWINAAGSVVSAPNSGMFTITAAGKREQFSAVAPAGAVTCYVYLRIYSATGAVTAGYVEMARPQFEYGTRATGWRDNGQVNAANIGATSAAVDRLSSAVDQQGSTLTSVAGRTTTLENAVNSTTNGLATKASASALDAVTNRVSAAEGVNASQSASITDLTNTVGAIQSGLGASGLDPAPGAAWQFDTTVEGWSGVNATLAANTGFVKITPTTADPQLHSPTASAAIDGKTYTRVRVGLTRRGGTAWTGTLYYSTSSHGFATSYRASAANPNIAIGQSAVVEWNMANLAAGGTDWVDNTIQRLRFNFANALDAVFDVDWIAVGRVGPSASSRAVSSLDSKVAQQEGTLISQGQALTSLGNRVTDAEGVNSAQASAISQIDTTVQQQGTALTAQAQRLDGIYVQVNPEMEGDSTGLAGATGGLVGVWTVQSAVVENGIATGQRIDTVQSQMGDVSASVQTVSKTVAGVDGKVSAMTTIKAETIAGGRRVMAGLALGSDGQTSEILAYAQRFAIVDESSGQMVLPFVVSNGQVFINQAVINTAFIQQIVAGMTIRSQAVNSQGLPLLELNFVTGAVSIRGQDVNGSTLLNNGGLYVYDAAGIERTAVGRLT